MQGQTLTASHSLIDADGLGTITYTWTTNAAVLGTGSSYLLTQAEVGKAVTVTARYTDGGNSVESVSSSSTAIVGNINDAPTGSVLISGTATQGQTLTASHSLIDADGLGIVTYTWTTNATVLGTGSSYLLTQAEVGKAVTVTARYTDGGNSVESVSSSSTAIVANINDAPSGSVSINGTAAQGQTLTVSNSLTDVDGLGSISYLWKSGSTELGTGRSYVLTQADVGTSIQVMARYTDGGNTFESVSSLTTSPVVNVNDLPIGSVTISGNAQIGQQLSVSHSLSDADGLGTLSYRWLADGVDIAGAVGSSWTVTQAQIGKSISVVATYTDGGGTLESVASNSLQIANYNTAARENTTAVTTVVVNDPLLGTARKFALSGPDAALFKISPQGALTFVTVRDFERPTDANRDGVYDVTVTIFNSKTGYRVLQNLKVGVEYTPIQGTGNNDNVKGSSLWDVLDGLGGHDTLTGGDGLDVFWISAGRDTVTDFNQLGKGNTGAEVLKVAAGATADVTLKSAWMASADTVNFGAVNLSSSGFNVDLSAITTGQGWNIGNKGAAAQFKGSAGHDSLVGGSGNDQLLGGEGNDVLSGGKGADILTGGTGADVFRLSGDTKTDHINDFQSGTDRIEFDRLVYKALAPGALNASQLALGNTATTAAHRVVYDVNTGNLWYDADGSGRGAAVLVGVLDNHVHISHTDLCVTNPGIQKNGSNQADSLAGTSGDDTLISGPGNDSISGSAGNDSLFAGDGDDTIAFAIDDLTGEDTLDGGSQFRADTLLLISAGTLVPTDLRNVSGIEILQLANGSNHITLGVNGKYAGISSVVGGSGADTISAVGYTDEGITLRGGRGADVLTGGEGNDTFLVDIGDVDTGECYDGGAGGSDHLLIKSSMDMSALNDADRSLTQVEVILLDHYVSLTLSSAMLSGEQLVLMGTGDNAEESVTVTGSTQSDFVDLTLIHVDIDDIRGLYIHGAGAGIDTILGTNGADTIVGGLQSDWLFGGGGNDRIFAGELNDTLIGGAGADFIDGGLGNDVFIYTQVSDAATDMAYGVMDTLSGANYGDIVDLRNFSNFEVGSFQVDIDPMSDRGDDYVASWRDGGQTYFTYLLNTGVTTGFEGNDRGGGMLTLGQPAIDSGNDLVTMLEGGTITGNSTIEHYVLSDETTENIVGSWNFATGHPAAGAGNIDNRFYHVLGNLSVDGGAGQDEIFVDGTDSTRATLSINLHNHSSRDIVDMSDEALALTDMNDEFLNVYGFDTGNTGDALRIKSQNYTDTNATNGGTDYVSTGMNFAGTFVSNLNVVNNDLLGVNSGAILEIDANFRTISDANDLAYVQGVLSTLANVQSGAQYLVIMYGGFDPANPSLATSTAYLYHVYVDRQGDGLDFADDDLDGSLTLNTYDESVYGDINGDNVFDANYGVELIYEQNADAIELVGVLHGVVGNGLTSANFINAT